MTPIIIAIIGSSAFTAIVNALIELIKNRTGQKSLFGKALRLCLLSDLQAYGTRLASQETLTREEYNQFCEMYQCYKALKGDGYADRLKAEVDEVPILK